MFGQFKISFHPVKDEWQPIIEAGKTKLSKNIMAAQYELNQLQRYTYNSKEIPNGNYVDEVAPMLDCITRFIDDSYESISQEVLAECYETNVDDLFLDIENVDILNKRYHHLNVIKKELSTNLSQIYRKIVNKFPTSGESAVYKKCGHCGAVYMKPTGCHYLGECGLKAGFAKDEDHNGTMTLKKNYEFKWTGNESDSLKIYNNDNIGVFEKLSNKYRRALRKAAKRLPVHNDNYMEYNDNDLSEYDMSQLDKAETAEYGCGRILRWGEMTALTHQELIDLKLVPPTTVAPSYEPVADIKTMAIDTFLSKKCGDAYEQYAAAFHSNGINTITELLELEELGGFEEMLEMFIPQKLHRMMFISKLSRGHYR